MRPIRRLGAVAILAAACASGAPAPPSGAPPGEGEADHSLSQEGWSRQAATDDDMTRRIRESAREIEAQGGAPRVAFADLRFPGSARERQALRDHGLLRLTAVCRDGAELPPARVFARGEAGETGLAALRVRLGQVPDSEVEILGAIGSARIDALYLLPLHLAARPGALVVDFARNRSGFVLGELPVVAEDADYRFEPPSGPPDPAALEVLIAREFPEFAAGPPP